MGDFLEHPLVHPAKLGSVHAVVFAQLVPHIVDADQNADDVGPQVDAVPLDTGVQIHHPGCRRMPRFKKLVAAGLLGAQLGGHQQRVAAAPAPGRQPPPAAGGVAFGVPEHPLLCHADHVCAVHIGDGIAGKQNAKFLHSEQILHVFTGPWLPDFFPIIPPESPARKPETGNVAGGFLYASPLFQVENLKPKKPPAARSYFEALFQVKSHI